jgi:hypothetical protein
MLKTTALDGMTKSYHLPCPALAPLPKLRSQRTQHQAQNRKALKNVDKIRAAVTKNEANEAIRDLVVDAVMSRASQGDVVATVTEIGTAIQTIEIRIAVIGQEIAIGMR